ncbi:ABC transporter permease [Haloquadratum walsbyi]|mgnify:CR=1 FL=1|jgi:spermidine/putrescine transport system permease protein|uniref:ABC-type transport system permease protein n=2 Tax=Haloquadratum walsbyi TaxID=293091 RepID=Q18K90_HALWD|nr:ABC transporter permease [Haloquadratum walsbyi]CAJ51561.1 ABC-type transport system permease protein [Haloquadratum walsbyi DSM 16790]CCC39458.1 ABC-type transport system permease protein [Haloquadratum walsbyi C23]
MSRITQLLGRVSFSSKTGSKILRFETIALFIFLYLPILVVIILSFSADSVPSFPISGLSIEWYLALIPIGRTFDAQLIRAFLMSVQIGIIAAIGSAVIGTAAAIGMVRNEYARWLFDVDTLNTLFITPMMVPWVVTGIAVLSLYSMVNIAGSFISLILGHILITLPFMIVVVAGQLYGFDRSLEDAARNLGAGPLRTFYEVTLPIISPGVIAGMMFAFTISFDNFTQTFFWTSSTLNTLPVVIFSRINFSLTPVVNAMGTVIVGVSLTMAFLAERLSSRVITD